jgi:hypothetical protein
VYREPNPNAAFRHQLVLQRKTCRVHLRNRGSLVTGAKHRNNIPQCRKITAVFGLSLQINLPSAATQISQLTKDGGVLRTVGDARAYILTLPKTRRSRAHWKRASLLLLEEVGAAALTRQIQVALVMDGKLDPMFERMSDARRWPDAYKQEED